MDERFMRVRLLHEPHSLIKMQDRIPKIATLDAVGDLQLRMRTPEEKRRWARNRLKKERAK